MREKKHCFSDKFDTVLFKNSTRSLCKAARDCQSVGVLLGVISEIFFYGAVGKDMSVCHMQGYQWIYTMSYIPNVNEERLQDLQDRITVIFITAKCN